MEPKIYKPSIYKGAGIYNGTGGIYNGCGVYNDGAGGGGSDNIIGGREYPVVDMPDGKKWIACNLDYKFDGCEINGNNNNIPAAWYYDKNEGLYNLDGQRPCGLLYNHYAVELLETNKDTLCPGWHVPSEAEWSNLISIIGSSVSAKKLKFDGSAAWINWYVGTNDYGFGALPSGREWTPSYFDGVGLRCYIWTSTKASSSSAKNIYMDWSDASVIQESDRTYGYVVRLVHD
jgi:uncharacterized protein (TIGR02145 family)